MTDGGTLFHQVDVSPLILEPLISSYFGCLLDLLVSNLFATQKRMDAKSRLVCRPCVGDVSFQYTLHLYLS